MTKDQIRTFARRLNYDEKVKIRFMDWKNERAYAIRYLKTIYLNKYITNFVELRNVLLHEIGHLRTKSASKSMEEYEAQIWAINRSIELRYNPQNLIEEFSEWLGYKWNSNHRRYVMAARIYFEKQNQKKIA
jgi:hypothetical protein